MCVRNNKTTYLNVKFVYEDKSSSRRLIILNCINIHHYSISTSVKIPISIISKPPHHIIIICAAKKRSAAPEEEEEDQAKEVHI